MNELTLSEKLRLDLLKTILQAEATAGPQQVSAVHLGYDPFLPSDPMARLQAKVNAMHDIVFGRAIQAQVAQQAQADPSEMTRCESTRQE